MWIWYGRLGCFVFVQTHALVLNVIDLSLISCLGANSLSSHSTNSLVIYCTKARYYEHYCYVLFAFSSFFPTFVCFSYPRLRACRFCCWCSWPCYFEPFLHKLLNFFVIYFSLDLFSPGIWIWRKHGMCGSYQRQSDYCGKRWWLPVLTLCERTGILTIFLSNFLLVPNLAFSFVITNAHKWSLKYCLFPLYPKTMVLTHSHVPCDADESERIQFSGGYQWLVEDQKSWA